MGDEEEEEDDEEEEERQNSDEEKQKKKKKRRKKYTLFSPSSSLKFQNLQKKFNVNAEIQNGFDKSIP